MRSRASSALIAHRVKTVSQPMGEDHTDPSAFLAESIHEMFDEYYSVSLSFWTRSGLKEKARQGHLVGSLPWGYVRDLTTKIAVPHPERAPLVLQLFERYATGQESDRTLAAWLNATGARTAVDGSSGRTPCARCCATPAHPPNPPSTTPKRYLKSSPASGTWRRRPSPPSDASSCSHCSSKSGRRTGKSSPCNHTTTSCPTSKAHSRSFNTNRHRVVPKAGATGVEPATSGVTVVSDRRRCLESPVSKPNLRPRPEPGHPGKKLQIAGLCCGFGHKSRFVPNDVGMRWGPQDWRPVRRTSERNRLVHARHPAGSAVL